jgi:hypothetical protein
MGKSARLLNKLFAEAEIVKAKTVAATEVFILIEVVGLAVIEKVRSQMRLKKKVYEDELIASSKANV